MTTSGPVGRTEPRLWTPPLVELNPETSYGFDLIDFGEQVLEVELDAWQQWLAIHMGELLPDGRPRFRTVLALVARQNGKTLLAKVLILYWLTIERVPLVLATSTDRTYAKLAWRDVCDMAEASRWLRPLVHIRKAIGEEALLIDGAAYGFAASNRKAGRSLTVHRLVVDELREHHSFDAWGAATNAMNAVADGQAVAITNQGDVDAVVLDSLRTAALDHLETGQGDPRLGLFEWSSPVGSDPTDLEALAMANPNLGRRVDQDALLSAGRRARAAGGEELASYKTEAMCMRVPVLDPAVEEHSWIACHDDNALDLAEHRDQVALCFDIALDGTHATLVAAATIEGRTHVDVVKAWSGAGCATEVRRDLGGIIRHIRPRAVGWLPKGPAAALAADLRRDRFAPRRTEVAEITGDLPSVCMGLREQVEAGDVAHSSDPMLTAHVTSAQKLHRGDVWVFTRQAATAIDGAYALAGAVHLARTLPPPAPPLTVIA